MTTVIMIMIIINMMMMMMMMMMKMMMMMMTTTMMMMTMMMVMMNQWWQPVAPFKGANMRSAQQEHDVDLAQVPSARRLKKHLCARRRLPKSIAVGQ